MNDVPCMALNGHPGSCNNNHLKRLIRNAEFDQPSARIADIDYTSERKLNKALITSLAGCDYIVHADYRNIFIIRATSNSKSYMTCALGMEDCKHCYKTKYVQPLTFLLNLKTAWKITVTRRRWQSTPTPSSSSSMISCR